MPSIDAIDRTLINRIQTSFPIHPRPFEIIAKDLGLTQSDVINRINRLKDRGIIRRIGGNFSPDRLGYTSTLCAASVPEEKVELFTAIVNSYSGVTHNYLRENAYNIWFTFIATTREEIETNLEEISVRTGIKDILNLPATHVFKISAQFKV
ncbi:MAG: Lrp/AsnC family transcriptional regulator [Pseudomonadota bacterium]